MCWQDVMIGRNARVEAKVVFIPSAGGLLVGADSHRLSILICEAGALDFWWWPFPNIDGTHRLASGPAGGSLFMTIEQYAAWVTGDIYVLDNGGIAANFAYVASYLEEAP